MPIRLSGLVSNMDTDSIVQELVSSYRFKTNKYKKAQTKIEWKQDAWKELNSKIYKLYSTTLSNMRRPSYYNKKKTTVSDENKASVIASAGAAIGSQTLEVKQVATQGYLTGGKLNSNQTITEKTTLGQLGISANGSINVTKGDTTYTMGVTSSTTIEEFTTALNDIGVNASFDAENQRFFITSKTTGSEENFTITGTNDGGKKALSALGLTEFYKTTGNKLTLQNVPSGAEAVIKGDTKLSALGIATNISFYLQPDVNKAEYGIIQLEPDTTIDEVVTKLKAAGVDAGFDQNKQRFYINSSTSIGWNADPTNSSNAAALQGDMEAALKKLGLFGDDVKEEKVGATKIEGQDAKILLNGAEFESSTNTFSVNGLTITARNVTDSKVTLSTEMDTDNIYNSIKDFFNQYNELIKEMDSLYNASSAKGYEPLTDEEKEAMSDAEIEKWEKKIKDSLFRRDGTLDGVINSVKTAMQSNIEINGKRYSLTSFGIKTESYFSSGDNEKGVYHIDGNADDATTSSKDDVLKHMIASDPETVSSFFSQLMTNVYDTLTDKMKSTELSSAFTVYNDKQLKNEYNDYSDKIDKWEKYVTEQEEYWYSRFTAMEKALSQLQSSSSALSGLLGS